MAACTHRERRNPPHHPHASPSTFPVFPTQTTQPTGLSKDHTALLDRVSETVQEDVDAAVGAVLAWNKNDTSEKVVEAIRKV